MLKGDKYKLGILIPGFFDKLDYWVKEADTLANDFLGYTKGQVQEKEGIKT